MFMKVMKEKNFVIFSVLTLCFTTTLSYKVHWTVKTKPIVIGEDVELFCKSSEPCHGCPLTWSAESDNHILISINDFSYDSTKYEASSGIKGSSLIIKKFSKIDRLYNYTCSLGFNSYTDNFQLSSKRDDNPIICFPERTKTTVYFNISRQAVVANVLLETVSPPPICKVSINGEDISSSLKLQIKESKQLYSATFELEYPISTIIICKENLQVEMGCLLSDKKISIFKESLKLNCAEYNEETNHSPLLQLSVLGVLSILPFILFLIFKIRKRKSSLHEPDNRSISENERELCIVKETKQNSCSDDLSTKKMLKSEVSRSLHIKTETC